MEYLTDDDYNIAEQNGISKVRAYQRFYVKGWSREEAITKPLANSQFKPYKAKCEEIGLNWHTFLRRVRRGMKPENALYPPAPPRITSERIKQAAENGICLDTLSARVYQYKWDFKSTSLSTFLREGMVKGGGDYET